MHHSPSHNNAPCSIFNIYSKPKPSTHYWHCSSVPQLPRSSSGYCFMPLIAGTCRRIIQQLLLYASTSYGYRCLGSHMNATLAVFLCAFDPEYKTLTIAITIVKEKHKLSYFQREIMLNLSGIYFHILHCTILKIIVHL